MKFHHVLAGSILTTGLVSATLGAPTIRVIDAKVKTSEQQPLLVQQSNSGLGKTPFVWANCWGIQIRGITVAFTQFFDLNPDDRRFFLNDADAQKYLNSLIPIMHQYCQINRKDTEGFIKPVPDSYAIIFHYKNAPPGQPGYAEAFRLQTQTSWTIEKNTMPESLLIDQRAAQAAQARRSAIETFAAQQREFAAQTNAKRQVGSQTLTTNPFIYKSEVVLIRTRFSKMIAENDAVFSFNGNVLATGVPSTRFQGNELVVLALRVSGVKTVNLGAGDVSIPYGDYVGVLDCPEVCAEFNKLVPN